MSHIAEVVNEDVGDIVITGVQTADKAAQGLKAADGKFGGIHQAGLMPQVKAHVARGFDADHASGLRVGGIVHQLKQLLGFAFTRTAHDKSDHMKSLLL